MKHAPSFPPLLNGHKATNGKDPARQAKAMAKKGKLGAGDLVWSEDQKNLKFALVLEPEVDKQRCAEMLFAAMTAFGDAAGAICPPEIAIHYQWPNVILMNEARLGNCDLQLSDNDTDGVPDWMIISLSVAIAPKTLKDDPGFMADETTMWDEGCGDITRTELLEAVSRHLVNWIHNWQEDGFKPIHDQWTGRLIEKQKIVPGLSDDAEFVSLDENGNALVNRDGQMELLRVLDALATLNGSDA